MPTEKVVRRKPKAERKEVELKIRFTRDQRRELDEAAKLANDSSTSSWIRRASLEAARRLMQKKEGSS